MGRISNFARQPNFSASLYITALISQLATLLLSRKNSCNYSTTAGFELATSRRSVEYHRPETIFANEGPLKLSRYSDSRLADSCSNRYVYTAVRSSDIPKPGRPIFPPLIITRSRIMYHDLPSGHATTFETDIILASSPPPLPSSMDLLERLSYKTRLLIRCIPQVWTLIKTSSIIIRS